MFNPRVVIIMKQVKSKTALEVYKAKDGSDWLTY